MQDIHRSPLLVLHNREQGRIVVLDMVQGNWDLDQSKISIDDVSRISSSIKEPNSELLLLECRFRQGDWWLHCRSHSSSSFLSNKQPFILIVSLLFIDALSISYDSVSSSCSKSSMALVLQTERNHAGSDRHLAGSETMVREETSSQFDPARYSWAELSTRAIRGRALNGSILIKSLLVSFSFQSTTSKRTDSGRYMLSAIDQHWSSSRYMSPRRAGCSYSRPTSDRASDVSLSVCLFLGSFMVNRWNSADVHSGQSLCSICWIPKVFFLVNTWIERWYIWILWHMQINEREVSMAYLCVARLSIWSLSIGGHARTHVVDVILFTFILCVLIEVRNRAHV